MAKKINMDSTTFDGVVDETRGHMKNVAGGHKEPLLLETTKVSVEKEKSVTKNAVTSYHRCADDHLALKLGDGLVIYGGNCGTPVMADCDVYIGFDSCMRFTGKQFPWMKGHEIRFLITDMNAPTEAQTPDFKKLVSWTIMQINAGRKVHAGCIGGHGRTGMFLAAIVKEMMGKKGAITYVRKNYCASAVESQSQIDWLNKEYGISKVKASKAWGAGGDFGFQYGGKGTGYYSQHESIKKLQYGELSTGSPVHTTTSLWGKSLAG